MVDRLYGTLEKRMKSWMETYTMIQGCCGGGNPIAKKDLLKERLLVAYDLTGAFDYMHRLRLLYRDIKPENIGFDVRGDVKVFDFGLMKSLEESLKIQGEGKYGYKLTAFTGSIPYMAPEVAMRQPYGTEADVYSFSMMLWEMITLDFAYPGITIYDFMTRVVKMDYRPPVGQNDPSQWPAVLKTVITEGWDRQPTKRPTMKRVGMLLRGLLEDMNSGTSDEDSITNRSTKLMNRSRRSMHGGMMSSSRDSVRVGSGNPLSVAAGSGQMMSNSKEGVTRGMSVHNLKIDF
jgi:serine/threonine protein kinase